MPSLKSIAALLALAALPAGADTISPLHMADLSARLYALGVAQSDALLLATAAKLRRESGIAAPLDWEGMMYHALFVAQADPALTALIDDLLAETTKGVASGPEYKLARLGEGAVETIPLIPFRGGEYAEVYVEGPPGSDFNLTILDANGLVVCLDKDRSHVAYCGWIPATDGAFHLEIENAGTTAADYALMTN